MKHWKKGLFLFLLVCTALGLLTLGFIVLELSVYWFDQQSVKQFDPERLQGKRELAPYLLLRPEPDTVMELSCPQPDGEPIQGEANINRFRFRYGEMSKGKPDNTFRIFMLGGSVVFNGPSNKTTISGYLESRLRERFPQGPNFEVINAGMTAYISMQELILLMTDVVDFNPDVVVVLDGYNDCLIPLTQEERLGYPYGFKTMEAAWYHSTEILKGMRRFSLWTHLLCGSHLARRLFPNISYSEALQGLRVKKPSDEVIQKADVESSADLLVKNWGKMRDIMQSNQIAAFFFLQPLQNDAGKFERFYNIVENKMESLPYKKEVTSLRTFLRERKELFYDEIHTYKEGNRLYAERIFEEMKSRNVLTF